MKQCLRCKSTKPLDAFPHDKLRKDGFYYWCKQCALEYRYEYFKTKKGIFLRMHRDQKRNSKVRKHPAPAYSVSELRAWGLSQKNFDVLFDNWVKSGYNQALTPSVDRRDDYKPYTIDNLLRICTFKENQKRGSQDQIDGINTKRCMAISQVDDDGKEIARFYSIKNASRVLNLCHANLARAVQQKRKAYGYYWNALSDSK